MFHPVNNSVKTKSLELKYYLGKYSFVIAPIFVQKQKIVCGIHILFHSKSKQTRDFCYFFNKIGSSQVITLMSGSIERQMTNSVLNVCFDFVS